jgi:hypothetical protein
MNQEPDCLPDDDSLFQVKLKRPNQQIANNLTANSNHNKHEQTQTSPLLLLPAEIRIEIYNYYIDIHIKALAPRPAPATTDNLLIYPGKLAELARSFTVCRQFREEIGNIFFTKHLHNVSFLFFQRDPFLRFLDGIGAKYPDFTADLHLQSCVNWNIYSSPIPEVLEQATRISKVVEELAVVHDQMFSEHGAVELRDGDWTVAVSWYVSRPSFGEPQWQRRHAISFKGHLGHFGLVRKL